MNAANNITKQKTMDKIFPTQVDIPERNRERVIDLLNQSLADIFDLHSQTKHAHWNVKGTDFYQLHILFDELAEMIFPYVDTIAERITALGGFAKGTSRMAADSSQVEEFPDVNSGMEVVHALIERYGVVANCMREDIDETEKLEDMGTNDLFIEITRVLDKALYFLESHIQD